MNSLILSVIDASTLCDHWKRKGILDIVISYIFCISTLAFEPWINNLHGLYKAKWMRQSQLDRTTEIVCGVAIACDRGHICYARLLEMCAIWPSLWTFLILFASIYSPMYVAFWNSEISSGRSRSRGFKCLKPSPQLWEGSILSLPMVVWPHCQDIVYCVQIVDSSGLGTFHLYPQIQNMFNRCTYLWACRICSCIGRYLNLKTWNHEGSSILSVLWYILGEDFMLHNIIHILNNVL